MPAGARGASSILVEMTSAGSLLNECETHSFNRSTAARFAAFLAAADVVGEVSQPADGFGIEAIALVPFDRSLHDAGLFEHLQVLGNRRLGEWEDTDEIAGRAGRALRQFANDADARRVTEGTKNGRGALLFDFEIFDDFHEYDGIVKNRY